VLKETDHSAMASSDVDQKYLGRIAQFLEDRNPDVSEALFQILGLSVVLSRKLYRARKLRRLDTTRDTRSLQLYHHIIWLSKEGLQILEAYVLPYTQDGQEGPECQVLAAKLHASFVHIFCLFHNDPPVTVASGHTPVVPAPVTMQYEADPEYYSGSGYESMTPQKEPTPPKRYSRGKQPSLRDPINSITSDASFLTNPYAGVPPGESPPPPQNLETPGYPPGLGLNVPHPANFIIPARNFIPIARTLFTTVTSAAAAFLPGAHPIRLSAAIEHAAFLWDCVHDHAGARQLARHTIRQLRDGEEAENRVSDEAFEDAAEMVQILGHIMRRRSFETTPRQGESGETSTGASSFAKFPQSSRQPDEHVFEPPQPEYAPPRTTERRRTPPPRPARPAEPAASPSRHPVRPAEPVTMPARQPTTRSRTGSTGSATALPPAPVSTKTTELPTPPRQSRESRRRSSNPPSMDGGPVGAATPPRRRESTKSSSTHRRGPSLQTSPQQPQPITPQRSNTVSSRRRRPSVDATTPPRPPPKDPGYSPVSKSGGKSRRSSATTSGRRVEFATEEPQRIHVNGNGAPRVNGYYNNAASDQRGKGER
jgi:hypothetical protein